MRRKTMTWNRQRQEWDIEYHAGPPVPRLIKCARCGEQKRVPNLGNKRAYCNVCQPIARITRGRAQFTVLRAIRSGRLRPVTDFKCVDCAAPATVYEHRRYDRPLEVVPVCRSCNVKRGPACWDEIAAPKIPAYFLEPAPL